MACCVFMAALLGGLTVIRTLITLALPGQASAQAWRLTDGKVTHG